MRERLNSKNIRLLLCCMPILIICAIIQYASFSVKMQEEIIWRFGSTEETADNYEQALEISADIEKRFGEALVSIYTRYDDHELKWIIEGQIDRWFSSPPTLNDLLSRTTNSPLIISTIVLLLIMIIILIEQDYRPNMSVLTLLRLPRPRSRYVLSKLISPSALMFLFWGLQYLVAILQTAQYFSTVTETVRPAGQSPWTFGFYRMLFPFVEPIWFPAIICALCILPMVFVTIVFIAKGGMKSWIYGILSIIGTVAAVLVVNRISNMWWLMPVLLIAVWLNCRTLINKGQIVQ